MTNSQHSIALRSAKPSVDEGQIFARYADEVTEGFLRFMLGRNVIDILARVYTQPGHEHSYRNVIFAERDCEIVGMAAGYTATERRRFSERPLEQAAGSAVLRMKIVGTLCAPLIRLLESINEGDFYLQFLAVSPEMRGQGVGAILLDAIEERARAAGAGRLALDVSAKNVGAKRLYERRGMRVESQWPKRLPIPGLTLLRMTKKF